MQANQRTLLSLLASVATHLAVLAALLGVPVAPPPPLTVLLTPRPVLVPRPRRARPAPPARRRWTRAALASASVRPRPLPPVPTNAPPAALAPVAPASSVPLASSALEPALVASSTAVPPEPPLAETYLATLLAALRGRIEYPLQARRLRWEGRALVRCTLARDGTIRALELVASSGHGLLDRAACRSLELMGTLPAPPPGLPDDPVIVTIPVRFELEE